MDTTTAPTPTTSTDRDPVWDTLEAQEAAIRDAARADLAKTSAHLDAARTAADPDREQALGALQECLETATDASDFLDTDLVGGQTTEAALAAALLAALEARGLSIVRKPW